MHTSVRNFSKGLETRQTTYYHCRTYTQVESHVGFVLIFFDLGGKGSLVGRWYFYSGLHGNTSLMYSVGFHVCFLFLFFIFFCTDMTI